MAFDPHQARDPDGKWSSGLMDSLEHQLRNKGHEKVAAHQLAIEIMTNQGTLDPNTGRLTAKGQERENMGRSGRRIDRHARNTGNRPEQLVYKAGKVHVK